MIGCFWSSAFSPDIKHALVQVQASSGGVNLPDETLSIS
jgi:hypothetical protein